MNENCAQTERKRYYQCKWQKCIKNNNLTNLFDIRAKQNNTTFDIFHTNHKWPFPW